MSIFDGLECLAWKADLQFWQGVAAIKEARAKGAIKDQADCEQAAQVGSAIAEEFGIPSILGGSFGKCACDVVFNGNGNPPQNIEPLQPYDSTPFKWNGATWVPFVGVGGTDISVGPDGTPWMVNSAGGIYRYDGNGWPKMPDGARDIGVGADGSVWIIGGDHVGIGGQDSTPFKWNGATWVPFVGVGGTRIAVGPDGTPWMVNSAGGIYRYDGNGWPKMPDGARDIGVGADGSVWIIGGDHVGIGGQDSTPFKWNGATWVPFVGVGGTRIAVGPDGTPWMVNSAGGIYRYDGNGWPKMPDGARDIGVGADGSVWIIGGDHA